MSTTRVRKEEIISEIETALRTGDPVKLRQLVDEARKQGIIPHHVAYTIDQVARKMTWGTISWTDIKKVERLLNKLRG